MRLILKENDTEKLGESKRKETSVKKCRMSQPKNLFIENADF